MMAVKIKKKRWKNVCHKKKLKFDDYKTCLEETEIENKINHLEKHKIFIDSLNEFLKQNKVMLKTQQ